MRTTVLLLALIFALSGCVPAADTPAKDASRTVITVNGPREDSVPGLAEQLDSLILAAPGCCSFELHWSTPVRAQERQRNLNGYQAAPSAAAIAKSLQAGWAVLIGSAGFERKVEESRGIRYITVTTAAAAKVVTSGGTEIAEFTGRTRRAERTESAEAELLDPQREPLLLSLAGESAADFADDLTAFLNGAVDVAQRK